MYYRLISLALLLSLCACVSTPEKVTHINYSLDEQIQRGDLAYREARLTDAESIYRGIVENNPQLTDIWFRLGNIYTRQDQLDAAIRAYETVLKTNPQNGAAWYNLSLVHLKEAVDTLEAANRRLPADSPYREGINTLHTNLMIRSEVSQSRAEQPKSEQPKADQLKVDPVMPEGKAP
jgi:tetratricopeptide (TPR) repeat protein